MSKTHSLYWCNVCQTRIPERDTVEDVFGHDCCPECDTRLNETV